MNVLCTFSSSFQVKIWHFTFFQMTKRVIQYFQRFGEVESFRTHSRGDFQFGFIQSVAMALAVLSKRTHRIANYYTLTVKPAHDKHQPDYDEFKPPAHDSPHHILNALNDDCLEHVFKQFGLFDLSVTADVCVRFQQHAIDAFQSKYNHAIDIDLDSEFRGHHDKLEAMIRNFGPSIHSIRVQSYVIPKLNSIDIFKMINKYVPALTDLNLSDFKIAENVDSVHPLFAKLERWSLSHCSFTNGAEKLLAPCAELKRHIEETDCCIDQTFPKLEEVNLSFSKIDDAKLKKFITLNPILEKLAIRHNNIYPSPSIMQAIGQHLKNLIELEIEEEYVDDSSQFQLCCIKKINL